MFVNYLHYLLLNAFTPKKLLALKSLTMFVLNCSLSSRPDENTKIYSNLDTDYLWMLNIQKSQFTFLFAFKIKSNHKLTKWAISSVQTRAKSSIGKVSLGTNLKKHLPYSHITQSFSTYELLFSLIYDGR